MRVNSLQSLRTQGDTATSTTVSVQSLVVELVKLVEEHYNDSKTMKDNKNESSSQTDEVAFLNICEFKFIRKIFGRSIDMLVRAEQYSYLAFWIV